MIEINPVDFTKTTRPHSVHSNPVGLIWKETTPNRTWFMELWIPATAEMTTSFYGNEYICTHVSLNHSGPTMLVSCLSERVRGLRNLIEHQSESKWSSLELYIDNNALKNFLTALRESGYKSPKDYCNLPNPSNMYYREGYSLSLQHFLNKRGITYR